MWRTHVCAGQGVIHRCFGCGQPGCKPGFASTVADSRPVVHRCPPAIHRISTGFVPRAGDNAGTLPARRPQNLQQQIHTRPQAVDGEVTVGTCPHRFPQHLSTSVRKIGSACPPLGTNPWGRTVDNVGTPGAAKSERPWSGGITAMRDPGLRSRPCRAALWSPEPGQPERRGPMVT